jgi:hypothetical protein
MGFMGSPMLPHQPVSTTAVCCGSALEASCPRVPTMLHRALRLRSSPSAVRGPVLRPPCIRHLAAPCTAGARHGLLARVRAFAPHRGAVDGSPHVLPFRRLFLAFQKLTCSDISPPLLLATLAERERSDAARSRTVQVAPGLRHDASRCRILHTCRSKSLGFLAIF